MHPNKITLFYQNVRGLRTKTHQFKQNILTYNYDVILITETWLTGVFYANELCDDRYDVYRCDRNLNTSTKKSGGGVMICIKRSLRAQQRSDWVCGDIESVWLTVSANALRTGDKRNLHICLVYIPPDNMQVIRLASLTNALVNILPHYTNDSFIIAGDFNLSNIGWSLAGPVFHKRGSVELRNAAADFIELCDMAGIHQQNFHTNSCNNTLDLIFSDTNLEISRSESFLVSEDIYHPCLELDASEFITPCLKSKSVTRYNFYKADYNNLNNYYAQINWDSLLKGDTINDIVRQFYHEINTGIDKFVPKTTYSSMKNYPAWYSSSLKHIISDKLKAHSRWKSSNNPRDYIEFSILRSRQKKIQAKCYKSYLEKVQFSLKRDPKKIWSYIKSLRNNKTGYPNTLTLKNITYNNEIEACEGFNSFFKNVFQQPASSYSGHLQLYPETADTVHNLSISEKYVLKVLKSLDPNKGPGSDGIPAIFAKNCAETLAKPLHTIFNLSVNVFGTYPDIWKDAKIVPVHKSGSRIRIENYRPISILNTFGKVFEKIMYHEICSTIYKSIPEEQHGFTNKRSTITNLTVFTDYILRSMDEGAQVDAIYTDFEKAFDKVDHIILLHKLQALGIRGDLHRWFSSYVAKRRQFVVVGNARSDYITITSGVPQGSILAPLLYNAYLFDINTCLSKSNYLMFADDKKVYLKIRKKQDCNNIQNDLNSLSNYYMNNRITVNSSKCLQITFTRKTKPIEYNYYINNVIIKKATSVRDLGIKLDSKMSFNEHIDMITDKAYKQLGFVRRVCTSFKDIDCIKVLYFTFVRSILEYACSIWSPCYTINIERIESIQYKFIKFLCFKGYKHFGTYAEACNYFRLDTLELRRRQYDVILLKDILSGNIDCNLLLEKINFQTPSFRTRHSALFCVPRVSTNYAQNSVMCRLARTYNKYYSTLDLFFMSKNVLKNEIKKIHRSYI